MFLFILLLIPTALNGEGMLWITLLVKVVLYYFISILKSE